ncbi:hypothetical protein IAT40_001694 [Kwoniella sp. CBS 6097]
MLLIYAQSAIPRFAIALLCLLFLFSLGTQTSWSLTHHITPAAFFTNQSTPILSHETHQWLNSFRDRLDIPGLAVVVVTAPHFKQSNRSQPGLDGSGSLEDGQWKSEIFTSGVADLEDRPLTSKSLFSIASNTKLLTALSLGILIDRETPIPTNLSSTASSHGDVLSWNTKPQDILPGWGLADRAAGEEATLKDVLTMRTGVPHHGQAPSYADLDSALESMRNLPMSSPFRESWQYNNCHYDLLGHIVAKVSNSSIDRFVHDEILDPLGMHSAGYDSARAKQTGLLTTAFIRSGRAPLVGSMANAQDGFEPGDKGKKRLARAMERKSISWWTKGTGEASWSGSGLIMNAIDVAQWLKELLSPSILPPHILAECSTPHFPSQHILWREMEDTYYGYGQWISKYRGHKAISHYGYNLGQQTNFVRLPEDGIAIGLFNMDDESGQTISEVVVYRVLDELLGLAPRNPDWEEEVLGEWKAEQTSRLHDKRPDPAKSSSVENDDVRDDDITARELAVGSFTHSGWGTLDFVPFQPKLRSNHYHLADLLRTSIDDFVEPYSIASMPGREDWYFLLSPAKQNDQRPANKVRYTTIQIHDHHTRSGVIRDGIARALKSGDAWVDERGFGVFDNFWGVYAASPVYRSFPSLAAEVQGGPEEFAQNQSGRHDPKESAEVWFDRIHP